MLFMALIMMSLPPRTINLLIYSVLHKCVVSYIETAHFLPPQFPHNSPRFNS